MVTRIGEVLYWFGCILAALWAAGWVIDAIRDTNPIGPIIFAAVGALVIWAPSRAILYVLAGR